MVRIRLRRMGMKHKPAYRVVIADSHAPRDGKFIETIGHYNPQAQPKVVFIKEDRARYWLSVGAQPSDTVVRLLKNLGVVDAEGKLIGEAPAKVEAPVKKAKKAVTKAAAAAPAAAVAAPVKAAAEAGEFAGSVRPLANGSAPEGYAIKGNQNSMLYHVPGSRYYNSTVAELWFDTVESAEAAGFRAPGQKSAE
ncbi:small subunit ribosomal protein S16 [Herpetosiphon giganteus]|nr:small subunit ribosomal protein S16 [Herpetosiphon giganteus]